MQFTWLEKKLQHAIEGQWYGSLRSFFYGTGLEVEDFRTYQTGDSPRNINRKMSAKHDALRVNKRQEEKDIQVDILLDINYNRSGGRTQTNREIVQEWLADYMLFAKKHHIQSTTVFAPQQGILMASSLCSLSSWLQGFVVWNEEVCVCQKKPVYKSFLHAFMEREKGKEKQRVIILFSDFLCLTQAQRDDLGWLDQKHILAQIRIDVPEIVGGNFVRI